MAELLITIQIKAELLAIQAASPDNMLYVERAVEWARENKTSALHNALEWDDARAAHEHRLSQVRRLIQIHVVTEDRQPILVSLRFDRVRGGGYREVDTVLQDRDMTARMVADALADLERVKERYEQVVELAHVWDAVETVRVQERGRSRRNRPDGEARA